MAEFLSEDHLMLLGLAKDAVAAENSKLWKVNIQEAFEAHGYAVERLWAELRRQLQLHGDVVNLEPVIPSPKQVARELRVQLVAALRSKLPELIEEAIGDIE